MAAMGRGVVVENVLVFLLLLACLARMSLLFWSMYFAFSGLFVESLACFGGCYVIRNLSETINERISA